MQVLAAFLLPEAPTGPESWSLTLQHKLEREIVRILESAAQVC